MTGVCSNKNLELIKSIGADSVIDYNKENILDSKKKFDLIIDIAANITTKGYKKLLAPGGTGILVGYSTMTQMIGVSLKGKSLKKKNGLTTSPSSLINLTSDSYF